MKNTKNQVLSIPKELSGLTHNTKFAYICLRNLLYSTYVSSVHFKQPLKDFSITARGIVTAYIGCVNQYNIKLFRNDVEQALFADTLTKFDRNAINKNEQIVILKNTLSSTPKVDKYSLLILFCHIAVECSLQLMDENSTLNEFQIKGIVDACTKKMLIKLSNNIIGFFVNQIKEIYGATL